MCSILGSKLRDIHYVLQYTVKYNDSNNQNTQQDVTKNENSVQYHIIKQGKDIWIVNDFGRVSIVIDSTVLKPACGYLHVSKY